MKLNITYFFFFSMMVVFPSIAQDNFSKGIAAYNQKDYHLAVTEFEKAVDADANNVAAWFNLGLSNIGKKAYSEAILDFEKVLKYSPNDSEAEAKIEYCFAALHPEIEWSPRLNSIESSLYSLSPNTWSIISIVLSVICALLIVFYFNFTRKRSSIRNAILAINIFFICCLISSIVISSRATDYYSNENFAVVTLKSIPTFIENSPSPKTTIPEGIRVEIIENLKNDFVHVKTLTGEVHRVRLKELKVI